MNITVLKSEIYDNLSQETIAFYAEFKCQFEPLHGANVRFSVRNDGQGGAHHYEPLNTAQDGLKAFLALMNEKLATYNFEACGMTLTMDMDILTTQLACEA